MKRFLIIAGVLAVFGLVGRMDCEDAQRNADLNQDVYAAAKKRDKEPRVVVVDAQGEPQLVSAMEAFATAVPAHPECQPVFMEGR